MPDDDIYSADNNISDYVAEAENDRQLTQVNYSDADLKTGQRPLMAEDFQRVENLPMRYIHRLQRLQSSGPKTQTDLI